MKAMKFCRVLVVSAASALAVWSPTAPARADDAHPEFTILPVLGGDSDVGFGGGYIASLAKIQPEFKPYLYRSGIPCAWRHGTR